MRVTSSAFQGVVAVLLLMTLLGSGCASKRYGEQITTVNYYPQCYSPIQDLRDADSSYNTTVATSTVTGTLLGALVGYLATGKIEGAAAGAAVGLAGGAAMGYTSAEQKRNEDDNRKLSNYLTQIDTDISGMDRATAAARVAKKCYDARFREAIATYKAGKMSKDELNLRYTEIKNGSSEVASILGAVVDSATEKESTYQTAINEEAERLNQPKPVISTASVSTPKKTPAHSKNKSNRQSNRPSLTKNASQDQELNSMVNGAQRLNASKQTAIDEQKAIYSMQTDMENTLATVMS